MRRTTLQLLLALTASVLAPAQSKVAPAGAANAVASDQGPKSKAQAPAPSPTNKGAPPKGQSPQGPSKPGATPQGPGGKGPGKRPPGARRPPPAKAKDISNPESAPPVLTSVYGHGDPVALGVSEDGTRVYSVEGASIAVLDATQEKFPEVERIPLDATVFSLVQAGKKLFVAGGSNGAGVMDLEAPEHPLKWFDSADSKPCTQVGLAGNLIAATFASASGSELRVYLKGSLALLGKSTLPGRAVDFAIEGEYAYLALGPAGVARADLKYVKKPKVEPGPDLTALTLPPSFKLGRGFARDVAIGGNSLYVAADAAGLVEIDLGATWGDASSVHQRPLSFLGKPAYAVRLSARGSRIAVASTRAPSVLNDGAPLGLLGRIGWDLTIGDVAPNSFASGASEALWLFRHDEGRALEIEAVEPVPDSGWRSLVLRGRRVFEQHVKIGLIVREIAAEPKLALAGDAKLPIGDELKVLTHRQPAGLPCVDGKPSLRDPRLLLFGIDSEGADGKGFLRIAPGDQLKPVDELADHAPIGVAVGAQWPDVLTSREWCISSSGKSWRVNRLTHRPKYELVGWEIAPPVPPDADDGGVRGKPSFNSARFDDLILCARSGTRFGLVGYNAKLLTKAANDAKPGAVLGVKPIWQAETHFDGEVSDSRTFKVALFGLEDGRRIAAIAAGANTDPKSEHFQAPQIVLYDVTHSIATPPVKLKTLWGKDPKGLAVGVDACQIRSRSYVVVATTAGELLVFDCNDPTKAHEVRRFQAPKNAYDGQRENLLDVEIASDVKAQRTFAYLAAGRAGLIRVELTQPGGEDLVADTLLSTPGWASGVCSTVIGGERYWLVGDQKSGLRLYR